MFKCDKCGCEHTSRTVCPKCGAPVVIVNQDYLLRRQQWEEQQRNNLRYKKKGESEKNSVGVAEKMLGLRIIFSLKSTIKSRFPTRSGGKRSVKKTLRN